MKIQIVVPAINLWQKYTKPCIDSLQEAMMHAKAHGLDANIILIDNASTDDTVVAAPPLESDLLHYHRNNERWGFQKSVNFGVNYGWEHGAQLALVCNNDIVIHPEAIWRLAERFSQGDVGMVTCMDVRGEMQERAIFPTSIGTLLTHDKESVEEAPHPNFSAFMISKEASEQVGEFDEIFAPAYFEDNDIHRRLNLLEIKAIVYPPAMFYHYGSRTQNEAQEDGQPIVPGGLFENARANFSKKWGGLPGQETFTHPYNDESKSLKSTYQNQNA